MQIQPIQHPLTGLFEGIQRGISLGLTMNKLKQEQQEREELFNLQKQKAQAEQGYQEKESNRRTLESALTMINDKYIPKAIKLRIYNESVVPLANKLGFQMTEIDDWPDEIDGYIKRASEIYKNKDYTWQQKKDLLTMLAVETKNDPSLKPMFDDIDKKLEQEQQLAEQRAFMLYDKFLNNKITPDEVDELEEILNQNYNAYRNGIEAAINNMRNKLLMQKTQKEIENLETDYKVYYNPVKKDTILVNVKDPTKIEEARKQGYRLYVGGLFESQAGESKYTLPQKLDDLRAEYDRAVDALRTEYGLKGGLVTKALFELDETTRNNYLRDLDKINERYNKEYKRLTGRDAPFLVSSKNAEEQSSGRKPSLDEIFRGK